MNFLEFADVFGDHPVIDIRNVFTYFEGIDRRRLYEWQKRGLIVKVANSFYVMAGKRLDTETLNTIACRIYAPSYIGIQSALAWYNIIPEAVFQTTAITTRRNKLFETPVGDFGYRSIKKELFFGIQLAGQNKKSFFISNPEKTLLDHLYFVPGSDREETLIEMRVNLDVIRRLIDWSKLNKYLRLFASPKLKRATTRIMELANA